MSVNNYETYSCRERIVDCGEMTSLVQATERHLKAGAKEVVIQQETGRNIWHLEAKYTRRKS